MTNEKQDKFIENAQKALAKAEEKVNTAKTEAPAQPPSEVAMLKKFVDKNKLAFKTANGKVYLLSEAWQFIARMKGLTPTVMCVSHPATHVSGDAGPFSVKAECSLRDKDGITISQATMCADNREEFLKDKPDYAVYGMAQTRAISRAVKDIYGYLAKAAGFESTPFEEIGLEKNN